MTGRMAIGATPRERPPGLRPGAAVWHRRELLGGGLLLALEEGSHLGEPAVGVLPRAHVRVEAHAGIGVDAQEQPVGPDNLTHVAALDVDLEDGLAIATKVARVMWAHGAPAFVERSRRGAHVWSILDARLPAIVVRRGLRAFLHLAEIAPDPKIELRPGSDHVGNEGLGFALRMPMMPHPATGKRYVLCNPESGGPIGQSLSKILLAFEQAPADAC